MNVHVVSALIMRVENTMTHIIVIKLRTLLFNIGVMHSTELDNGLYRVVRNSACLNTRRGEGKR